LNPWKGSGAVEGILSRDVAHFLGWDRHWGMRDCRIFAEVGKLGLSSFVDY